VSCFVNAKAMVVAMVIMSSCLRPGVMVAAGMCLAVVSLGPVAELVLSADGRGMVLVVPAAGSSHRATILMCQGCTCSAGS
jgi:hypothetical protein